ncbi:MAG: hypothetical protein JWN80_1372 [Microbacteriaceae bacterium]|jgi:hypothetical protein|nr:hypothetical protein [Microbacteriaceae bacterium]
MTTLRSRIHPDTIVVYDWVQLERTVDLFMGSRSGVDHWLDEMAADQAFRQFIQAVAEAAGRPRQWPTNELVAALTYDPRLRALARTEAGVGPESRPRARRALATAS